MNQTRDRCGPAVAAVYRAKRHGELYLCGHCTNRLRAALLAQGWTIGPAGGHALVPQVNECPGASWQRTRRGRGFLAGGVVAGAGVGTGFFLGAYRLLTALAGPGQRAGLVAAIWIVYYLAFSVPIVAAGVATTHFGLRQTAVGYSAALAVLAAAAAGIFLFRRRSLPHGPVHRQAGPDG